MSFDFLDMMPQTVIVAPYTGQNGDGEPTHGAGVSYPARVEGRIRYVATRDGADRIAVRRVYLGTTASINVKDKITLPDGTSPPIIAVSPVDDEEGPHHVVVDTGSVMAGSNLG